MLVPTWAVIADDLTGACDTGVVFGRRGHIARVAFDPGADFSGCDIRVLTTESRAMMPVQAAQAVERGLTVLAGVERARIYKKIDSTLRGNPEIELTALQNALGIDRVLVCPAFPEQGRVVLDGWVFVNGVPLSQTSFGSEVPDENLLHLFGRNHECKALPLKVVRASPDRLTKVLADPGVFIADAETGADLQHLAQAGAEAGIKLYCGSAGLARALEELLPQGAYKAVFSQQPGPILVIAGSRAAATLEQVEAMRQQGASIFSPTLDTLLSETGLENLAIRVVDLLGREYPVIISIAALAPGDARQIANSLAQLAARVLERASIGGLILTGGETAAKVCHAIGCASIDLGGEVQPGVVWGWLGDGHYAGLPVITKAGGFGSRQTLAEAVHFLQNTN